LFCHGRKKTVLRVEEEKKRDGEIQITDGREGLGKMDRLENGVKSEIISGF